MPEVRIPGMLRRLTGEAASVNVDGATVGDVLRELDARFPGMAAELIDSDGKILRFVNLYLNDEDVRYLEGLDTPVGAQDSISILPAVAGGRT